MNKAVYRQNIVTGIVLIAVALAAFALAIPMPEKAAVFPKIVSMVLALLGGLLIVTTAVKMKKGTAIDEEALDPHTFLRPMAFMLMVILYVAGIRVIGFYVTTTVLLVVYMYIMGIRQPKALAITTVVVMVLIYLVFTTALKVRLPKGILM